jgi:6-phosphogluconolactonase
MPRRAYVGSYTAPAGELGWVGSKNPGKGITIYDFDEISGTLAPSGLPVVKQECPTWLEPSPCGRFLVASHELGGPKAALGVGFLSSYAIEEATGNLRLLSTQQTTGRGNTAVSFDKTGKFLLTTRYWEGGIAVLPIDGDGMIGPISCAPMHEGTGPNAVRQSMPHPHGVHADPVTNLIYAMDLGTDKVHQYILDEGSGELTLHSEVEMGAGTGPRGIAFHPVRRLAYVNCELGGVVVACTIDEVKGLVPFQTVLAYPEDFVCEGHAHNLGKGAFWTAEAAIAPDGAFLYVICRVHHSVAIFAVQQNGGLVFAGRTALLPGSNARNLTLDPSGRHCLIASQDVDQVECFRRDPSTGQLERTDVKPAPSAADVAVV